MAPVLFLSWSEAEPFKTGSFPPSPVLPLHFQPYKRIAMHPLWTPAGLPSPDAALTEFNPEPRILFTDEPHRMESNMLFLHINLLYL